METTCSSADARRYTRWLLPMALVTLAMAYPTAMMLGMLVEYLQKAGFVREWTVGDIWPWMFLLYVPAYGLARWRYR
jgi:hypothetical protein